MGKKPTSPVPIGDLVADKYRVEGILGVGGMGCVVEATHIDLLKRVAIKFVHEADAQDPQVAARFLREARAAVALTSEHIAHVLDVGTLPSGAPYMVMEHLEGMTLEERLEKSPPMPIDEVVAVILQACDALSEAHSKGIVHRDVKPANLFLVRRPTRNLFVKVLDFGISRASDPAIAVKQSLTGTSDVMGTPHYMAPEQMTSTKVVDARADIWALGVCLYRALTGVYPFDATTLMELGAMVLATEPRPVESLRPGISRELAAVVARCLRRDPNERFASAAELHAALASLPSRRTVAFAPGQGPLTPSSMPSVPPPMPVQMQMPLTPSASAPVLPYTPGGGIPSHTAQGTALPVQPVPTRSATSGGLVGTIVLGVAIAGMVGIVVVRRLSTHTPEVAAQGIVAPTPDPSSVASAAATGIVAPTAWPEPAPIVAMPTAAPSGEAPAATAGTAATAAPIAADPPRAAASAAPPAHHATTAPATAAPARTTKKHTTTTPAATAAPDER
jgi:serine/threonine protein kinase